MSVARHHVVAVHIALVAMLALAGCTSDAAPSPEPNPIPDVTPTPAPAGIRVAVVLPAEPAASAGELARAEADLADLAERRASDIASLRTVVPDAAVFAEDIGGLLADDGNDLVCVLGGDGQRTIERLAARYPGTRFCTLGTPSESAPANTDAFAVAFAELGHALGVVAAGVAGDGPVGLVRGDERADREQRRAGAVAALAGSDVVLDLVVEEPVVAAGEGDDEDAVADAVADVASDAADAVEDADLAALLLDASPPVGTAVLATGPAGAIVPTTLGDGEDAPPTVTRWAVRPSVVISAAVDRLLDPDASVPEVFGFGDEVFVVELDDRLPEEVVAAYREAVAGFAAGTRDPLAPVAVPEPDETEDGTDEGEGEP